MASITFYPTVDRMVNRGGIGNLTWANIRDGAGNTLWADETDDYVWLYSGDNAGQYVSLNRVIQIFDTSSIPDDAYISSAVLSLYGGTKANLIGTPALHVAGAVTASNTAIAASDYQNVGRTSYGSISYASYTASAYNAITLNASGIAAISKTGYTKLSLQLHWDLLNTTTGISHSALNSSGFPFKDTITSGTSQDPKLVITYIIPSSVTTSTMGTIGQTSGVANGDVTSAGDGTISERGFVYALTPNPTTTNSKLIVAGTTGSYSDTITGLASTTTYYVRAYSINEAGTSYGSQVSFTTLNSNPLQPSNLSPSGGTGVATTTPTLTWQHNPGSGNNSQASYQVIIVRQSDSVEMYDSGKTTATGSSLIVPGGASLAYGTAYQWKVRTWDSEDLVSPYSTNALFKPSQPPIAIITNPTSGVVTSETPTIEWTYSDPESTLQSQYRVKLYDFDSALLFDSTFINGTDVSYQLPAGYLQNGENYQIGVTVKDSDQVTSTEAMESFNVQFISPSPPTVVGSQTAQGFINLDIQLNKPEDDAWYEDYLKVYRKIDTGPWELVEANLPISKVTIDDFEDLDDWNESDEGISPTIGIAKVGTQSMAIGTSGAGDGIYERYLSGSSWASKDRLQLIIFTTVSSDFDSIDIKIGQSDTDYYTYSVPNTDLVDDSWVFIEIPADDLTPIGSPHRNTIDYLEISVLGASTAIAAGDLMIDEFRAIESSYEYTSYDAEFGKVYTYGVSAYNIAHSVESQISATTQFLIKTTEYLVNTYLIPEESPEDYVGGWMDGDFEPNWTSKTDTQYYEPKGSRTPIVFVNGTQRYIVGTAELRFFDEKFNGSDLEGAEALEAIKNFKPLIFKTWWGRTYRISIDGETDTVRNAGIGWYVRFDFTEID